MDILTKYIEFAFEITDAPVEFSNYLSLATVGIVLGRSRYIQFGDSQIFPNIWLIILAPSSFFRKSTVLTISSRCIYNTEPTLIYPTEFSHEKILEVLQENPQGVFYYYEFKTLQGMLSRDYMQGTKALLTELFDNPDTYNRITKGGSINIENPCISLLSATTADWFLSSIKSGDIEGGYLGRFIYVFSKNKVRDDAFPKEVNKNKRTELYSMLAKLREATKNQEFGMTLTDEAKDCYQKWYKKFISTFNKINPMYRTMFVRLNIYCLKFAIIIESCKNIENLTISKETIKDACQRTDWLFNNIKELCESELALNSYSRQENTIIKILKEKKEISRSELLRLTHLHSQDFNRVITTLLEKEFIKIEYRKSENSQKLTNFIIWIGNNNSQND